MGCATTAVNICRSRGDTAPFTVTITTDGLTPVNITGFGFLLTVDPSFEPVDALNNLFQLVGVVTSGPGGVVQFSLSVPQSNQLPGTYFYDVQMTDGGGFITTVLTGEWQVVQDITK